MVKKTLIRREDESEREFSERLANICNAQIELIRAYDEERTTDRYRETHDDVKDITLRGSLAAGQRILRHVLDFAEEIKQYEIKHPDYSNRTNVAEKKEFLSSLMR